MKSNRFESFNCIFGFTRSLWFILLAVAVLNSVAVAQKDQSNIDELEEMRRQKSASLPSIPQADKVLLDHKIDAKTYILGPGDVLSVFIWGNYQGQYTLTVSPEGMLLVPEVGPIEVASYTLEKASEIISSSILKRYRNVETVISLVNLRLFKVYIGGAVNIPGAYAATPVTR